MDFETTQRERQQKMSDEFGDHTFTLRGPTVFHLGRTIPYVTLKDVAAIDVGTSDYDAYTAIERSVLSLISGADVPNGEGMKHLDAAAARKEFQRIASDVEQEVPVTYADLLEIQGWMLREATRRPPTQDSSSSATQSSSGTSSTGTSSSEPESPSKD